MDQLRLDFTLTDLDGTSHNLIYYLDNGYTVFIDFSATMVWAMLGHTTFQEL